MALADIKHIVVLMMENRSLDGMLGYLYADSGNRPKTVIPAGSSPLYNGLAYFGPKDPKNPFWNPTDPAFFSGGPSGRIYASRQAENQTVPDPDPEEYFADMTYQLFGPQTPSPAAPNQMKGFYINYQKASSTPGQIMQMYAPAQLATLNGLAGIYAVSDQWFCSSPTQTWPNRAFVHTGTSNGRVNNWPYDPFDFNIPTIFNTLEKGKIGWKVYNDTAIESLARLQFPHLWDPLLEGHFHGFDAFKADAKNGALPAYSFLEPSFQIEPNDDHPPHDVTPGEQFLYDAWYAVVTGKNWGQTLFLITYDEHGGCYDHVPPPFGAKTPDAKSNPGEAGFTFNRFGVRVPAVLVCPFVPNGAVFRAPLASPFVPFDHTSVLATIQKWLKIPSSAMPPSARTQAAPALDSVMTLAKAADPVMTLTRPDAPKAVKIPGNAKPSAFQVGMAMAAEIRKRGKSFAAADAGVFAAQFTTRQSVIDYLLANAKRKN